jgi:hypothetical protein
MTDLFRRDARVQVGTQVLTGLRVAFKVSKSLRRNPNKSEIRIYNLSPASRAQIEQARNLPVKLEAGYLGSPLATYFLGELRDGKSVRDGTNIITTLNNGDGERQARTARTQRSFAPGTSVGAVVQALVQDVQLDPGNALRELGSAVLGNGMQIFAEGTNTSGNAMDALDNIARAAGFDLSVQSQALQVVRRGQSLPTTAVVLNADSGMLGSPEIDSKGVVKFRSLMNPDITPGRPLTIQSQFLNGTYRVEKIEVSGDTGGADWYVSGEAK